MKKENKIIMLHRIGNNYYGASIYKEKNNDFQYKIREIHLKPIELRIVTSIDKVMIVFEILIFNLYFSLSISVK